MIWIHMANSCDAITMFWLVKIMISTPFYFNKLYEIAVAWKCICIGVWLKQYAQMLIRRPKMPCQEPIILLLLHQSLSCAVICTSTTHSLRLVLLEYYRSIYLSLGDIYMEYVECMAITYLIFRRFNHLHNQKAWEDE
jgi:hypothetical protein